MRSHARSLLSIAKLKRASSLHRLAICKRTRIAQISLSLNGVFWPTSLPLFQGSRVVVVNAMVSIIGSFCWGASILQFFEKTVDDPKRSLGSLDSSHLTRRECGHPDRRVAHASGDF